jgi:hypothetical protein
MQPFGVDRFQCSRMILLGNPLFRRNQGFPITLIWKPGFTGFQQETPAVLPLVGVSRHSALCFSSLFVPPWLPSPPPISPCHPAGTRLSNVPTAEVAAPAACDTLDFASDVSRHEALDFALCISPWTSRRKFASCRECLLAATAIKWPCPPSRSPRSTLSTVNEYNGRLVGAVR